MSERKYRCVVGPGECPNEGIFPAFPLWFGNEQICFEHLTLRLMVAGGLDPMTAMKIHKSIIQGKGFAISEA